MRSKLLSFVVFGGLGALGCSSQAGPGPSAVTTESTTTPASTQPSLGGTTPAPLPSQATASPPQTASATASAPVSSTGGGSSTSSGTLPPASASGNAPGNAPGKCKADADCGKGMHCSLGLPLNGTCWADGKPEPRCLSGDTRIATPTGEVRVRDLAPGAMVWTLDAHGARVAAPLERTAHLPVAADHEMLSMTLDDGRTLSVSPEHPTCASASRGSGRAPEVLADIPVGQRYDGALVKQSERVLYGKPETFDVLPAGETGCYWANGVLLGSTLR